MKKGYYYSTPYSEPQEVKKMDKNYIKNALAKWERMEIHENNKEFVEHNIKELKRN